MIHLFAVILLAICARASFICPPAQEIYPCECNPPRTVQCKDVINISLIQKVLEGQFVENIPRLVLTNVHAFSLPTRAFGDLFLKRIIIRDSNIRHIEKDAFEGQRTSLGFLMLSDDRLQEIPAEALRQLTSLRTLSLAGNFLMQVRDGSLDSLVNLRFLVLSDNRISHIDRQAFPRNLENLLLSRNLLRTFNGSLRSLERLSVVYARDNRLTSIEGEFDGLHHLKHLYLERNYISEIPDSFANLTSLTSLSLSGNRIEDVSKSLMNLHQLKLLDLSNNYITELHWRIFEKLKDLESLNLSGNYLKAICPSLKPLRSLKQLALSDVGLRTLSPDCFHNMKSLQTLDLSHNRLVNIDAVSRHPLPALERLYVNHNQLSSLRYEMKYAKVLQEMDISFNNFTSLKANYLSCNKELAVFRMEGNPWRCTEIMILMLRDLEERGVDLKGRPDC